jgi:DNA-binding winged helix-turn-helix (wHTH) protein
MHFGPFAIDTPRWELTREGVRVELSPRLVEILAYLAANSGHIITKEALLHRFWPDVHVAENTLTRAIADIRKAVDDDAAAPTYIQTVARRGYRFIAHSTARSSCTALCAPGWHLSHAGQAADPFLLWVKGKLSLESLDARRLRGHADVRPRPCGTRQHLLSAVRTGTAGSVRRSRDARARHQPCATRDNPRPDTRRGVGTLGYLLARTGEVERRRRRRFEGQNRYRICGWSCKSLTLLRELINGGGGGS